jgi:hypothetical protein
MALGSGNAFGGSGIGEWLRDYGGAAGDLLGQQVEGETEEMKRRKALLQQMQEAVSPLGASSTLGMTGGGGRRSAFGGFGFRASRGG